MIKHLFKLIWNKKKANALITIEILLSFLVLFAVATMGALYLYRYNIPLGYNIDNVWMVVIDTRLPWNDTTKNELKRTTVKQLLIALHQMPEIEGMCALANPPYSTWESRRGDTVNGKFILANMNNASEDAKDILGLHLVEGRWFEPGDKALPWTPAVINQQFAKERFGNESPLGKDPWAPRKDEKERHETRIVGVISDFRKGGEFTSPTNQMIEYSDIEKTTTNFTSNILIKVKPGVTTAFTEKLVKAMESVAKDWSFDVRTLEDMKQKDFKPRITAMIAIGLIAGFLLMMVALGLIGVLWQNVSQRTQEIGLRRALGSTEKAMYGQIISELLVLTTFGLIIGTIIIVQFPLLNLINSVPSIIYIEGFVIATILMYLLTFASALYPSWLTMGIEPAEALHYE